MKKLIFVLLLALGAGAAQGQVKFETKSTDAVREMAIKQGKLVFIDLYASWCPPCRMMERQVFSRKDVGEFMDEFVTLSEPHDDPSDPAPLSPDSKDDYLIALALDSRADALVFGDSDLHGLDVLGLRVFTPRELLDRYLLDQDV